MSDEKNTQDQVVDRGDELRPPTDTSGTPDGKDGGGEELEREGDGEVTDKLDPDKEGEETPEEKAERERLEAEEAKKRNIRIPKSRFDEAQAKARAREQALLEEIEKLKGGQQATATQVAVAEKRSKIDELQDKYEDLILDGRRDEARKVRKQVDTLREELIEYQTSVKSDAARRAAIEELSYSAKLASFEAQYPALNPEHDEFSEEKTSEVAALMEAFVKSGSKHSDALAKAVKYVLGPPPEQKVSDAAKVLAETRAKQAREKAAEANRRQPADMAKVGLDSDKAGKGGEGGIDIMRMTQDKFAKLDEETKAKLRGDEV